MNTRHQGPEWLNTKPGEQCRIHIASLESGGLFSTVEVLASPRFTVPPHIHDQADEHFIVLEGQARFEAAGKVLEATAGASFSVKRGIAHTWTNTSPTDDLRLIIVFSPGGFEEFFELLASGKIADEDAVLTQYASRFVDGVTQ